jgi:hypothetical protein
LVTWVADLDAVWPAIATRPAAISSAACSRDRARPRLTSSESSLALAGIARPGSAELALLAALAWPRRALWVRPAASGARPRTAGLAELAEDLAQPVVYLFQDRGALVKVDLVEVGKPFDGLVDPGISGGGESRPRPFFVHVFSFPLAPDNQRGPRSALTSRVNGTAD